MRNNDTKRALDQIEEVRALRFNDGKPKYSLLDLTCLEPGVKVLEFGAKKYARDNYKKGLVLSEILDSMMRHIAAIQRGEFIDPESGLEHIGHIQCNALFLGLPTNTKDIKDDNLNLKELDEQTELADTLSLSGNYEALRKQLNEDNQPVSFEEYDKWRREVESIKRRVKQVHLTEDKDG